MWRPLQFVRIWELQGSYWSTIEGDLHIPTPHSRNIYNCGNICCHHKPIAIYSPISSILSNSENKFFFAWNITCDESNGSLINILSNLFFGCHLPVSTMRRISLFWIQWTQTNPNLITQVVNWWKLLHVMKSGAVFSSHWAHCRIQYSAGLMKTEWTCQNKFKFSEKSLVLNTVILETLTNKFAEHQPRGKVLGWSSANSRTKIFFCIFMRDVNKRCKNVACSPRSNEFMNKSCNLILWVPGSIIYMGWGHNYLIGVYNS